MASEKLNDSKNKSEEKEDNQVLEKKSDIRICPRCNKEVNNDLKECPSCHSLLFFDKN